MNRVEGSVQSIEESDVVTYIRVKSGEETITLIKTKAPEWLGVGDRVCCTFQEASVCVSKDCPGKVSIENRLSATLVDVREGGSLCELTFESGIGEVVSLITSRAYESLGLETGCRATMLLRGVDINLEPVLVPIDIDKYRNILNGSRA